MAIRGQAPGPAVRDRVAATLAAVCPYRGLRPFREEDAPFFFGREAFTDRLAAAVERKSFVAVVGASGSGKSSVVLAGLVPRLRKAQSGAAWDIITLKPGDRPLVALAGALLPLLEPDQDEVERLVQVNRLAGHLASGEVSLADVATRALVKQPGTDRLMLVVDQWEELYTLGGDEPARLKFVDQLLAATTERGPLRVVLTMRGDFYGHAIGHRGLSDRMQDALINLPPMNRDELRLAVEGPAQKVGIEFEPGLVDRLLDAVGGEPGNLPLLEFVLGALWERRRGRLLHHDAYRDIGELQGAMAKKADEVFEGFKPPQQALARKVMLEMVRLGEATEDTRRRARLPEDQAIREVVGKLTDARLVVTGRDDATGEETVEVAHEALIRRWDRLRGWLNEDRELLLWKQRLANSMAEWERAKQDAELLLRGSALAEAERWLGSRPEDIDPAEGGFIKASRAARRRRKMTVGVVALAVLVMLGGVGWWVQRGRQRADLETAFSGNLQGNPRESFHALVGLVDRFGGIRPEVMTAEVKSGVVDLFAGSSLASDSVAPSDLVRGIEGVYPPLMDSRDAFGAIAWRLDDIAARRPELRAQALELREKVRSGFMAANHPTPPSEAADTLINRRVPLPGGRFPMGSPAAVGASDEHPQHPVRLSPFRIQAHEVTNAEYRRFDPAYDPEAQEKLPVIGVSWYQAMAYAAWLGGSLPTEAQWEFAARGSEGRQYPWGDSLPVRGRAAYDSIATAPVGSHPAGATPEGLQDLAGNVGEWCRDRYGFYPQTESADSSDPPGPETGDWRVMRGGSFGYGAPLLRSASRYNFHPANDGGSFGFRVVWASSGGQQ